LSEGRPAAGPARTFPPGFLWGTATSAYQIEGSVAAGGRGASIWDVFSARPGATRNGDTGEVACDHYRRLDEDLDLLGHLGAPAYRFSVSWPRIQPDGTGPVNQAGLDFYRRLVDGLRQRGLVPLATLYHWDLPQALDETGGWLSRTTSSRFAEYAAAVVRALGDRVGRIITLNEPWCSAFAGYGSGRHAPGRRSIGEAAAAAHHLLLAHGQAVQALRAEAPGVPLGISLNLSQIRPATEHEQDRAAAGRVDGNLNRLFLEPLLRGRYPADMAAHYGGHWPGLEAPADGDLETIAQPLDFLGVNYYTARTIAASGRLAEARAAGYWIPTADRDPVTADLDAYDVRRPDARRTEMGWEMDPAGLGELLVRLHREYGGIPIIVTENGTACDDYLDPRGRVVDRDRINYLSVHVAALLDALASGVDVQGYLVWSLMDNFEWAHGYSKRFGLVYVDYPSGARTKKTSFDWYRELVAGNGQASGTLR
jgi:beta-glucosidase